MTSETQLLRTTVSLWFSSVIFDELCYYCDVMNKNQAIFIGLLLGLSNGASCTAYAQDLSFGYSNFGGPGMIDMPVAGAATDAELAFNALWFQNTRRYNLSFQFLPRLSATFRYNQLFDISLDVDSESRAPQNFQFDRSFSINYLLLPEGSLHPAISIGLNDILGNGLFQSEFFAATKTFGNRARATIGLGWGRLAGVNSFENPFGWDDRPPPNLTPEDSIGGQPQGEVLFHGPAAFFAGIEWQASDRLRLIAEYSSDDYIYEDGFSFDQRSPLNFGAAYQVSPSIGLTAHYLYGSEFGAQFTYTINPRDSAFGSGNDPSPLPVVSRNDRAASSWSRDPNVIMDQTKAALSAQGISLSGYAILGQRVSISIETDTYGIRSQTVGRAMRALTNVMPPEVTIFAVTLIESGIPVTEVTLARADVEELDFDIDLAWESYTRATIEDAPAWTALPNVFPRLDWGLEPSLVYSLFDPDAPLRVGLGIDLYGAWEPAPGIIFSGSIRKQFFGNIDDATRPSDSVLPRVRSESNIYDRADPSVPRLTGAWYFRPGDDIFGRVTVGYLESMFGGISGEVLWAPNDRRLALGIEVSEVIQRDFDQLFGFRDYQVTTGHVSAYYDHSSGYGFQLDAGRYLAGDWGATFTLDRTFDNGWRVAAFATLTDVPFEEFGEGSFDKGIIVEIPVSVASGLSDQRVTSLMIRPILRDGGARLNIDGRLYEVVRDAQGAALEDTWGRFWR